MDDELNSITQKFDFLTADLNEKIHSVREYNSEIRDIISGYRKDLNNLELYIQKMRTKNQRLWLFSVAFPIVLLIIASIFIYTQTEGITGSETSASHQHSDIEILKDQLIMLEKKILSVSTKPTIIETDANIHNRMDNLSGDIKDIQKEFKDIKETFNSMSNNFNELGRYLQESEILQRDTS